MGRGSAVLCFTTGGAMLQREIEAADARCCSSLFRKDTYLITYVHVVHMLMFNSLIILTCVIYLGFLIGHKHAVKMCMVRQKKLCRTDRGEY